MSSSGVTWKSAPAPASMNRVVEVRPVWRPRARGELLHAVGAGDVRKPPSGMRIFSPARKSWYFVVSVCSRTASSTTRRSRSRSGRRGRCSRRSRRWRTRPGTPRTRPKPPGRARACTAPAPRCRRSTSAGGTARGRRRRTWSATGPPPPSGLRRRGRRPPSGASSAASSSAAGDGGGAAFGLSSFVFGVGLLVAARLVGLGRGVRQRRLALPTSWRASCASWPPASSSSPRPTATRTGRAARPRTRAHAPGVVRVKR